MSYIPKTVWVTTIPWTTIKVAPGENPLLPKSPESKIEDYLRVNPWCYMTDIAKATKIPSVSTTRCLLRMEQAKVIHSRPGHKPKTRLWGLVDVPA